MGSSVGAANSLDDVGVTTSEPSTGGVVAGGAVSLDGPSVVISEETESLPLSGVVSEIGGVVADSSGVVVSDGVVSIDEGGGVVVTTGGVVVAAGGVVVTTGGVVTTGAGVVAGGTYVLTYSPSPSPI